MLASRKYGDYEIFLLGSDVYKVSNSDDICVQTLIIMLAKDGEEGGWINHIKTEQFELGCTVFNILDPYELDEAINIIELDAGTLIAFRPDDNDVVFFRIANDKFEEVIPEQSYNNRLNLSKNFRVEGNAIIDDNYDHPFTFYFE